MARKRQTVEPDLFARTEPQVEEATRREGDIVRDRPGDIETRRQGDVAPGRQGNKAIKMAFYLSPEVCEAVEMEYARRRSRATGDRRKASRSSIVEEALRVRLGLG